MYTFLAPSGTELQVVKLLYVHCTFWHRVAGGETMYTFIAPSGTELQVVKLRIRFAECTHSFTSCSSVPEDATLDTFRCAYRFPRVNAAGFVT